MIAWQGVKKKVNWLAVIREIFTSLLKIAKRKNFFGENVTLAEKLEAFCVRCSLRQYIPSKPAKLKIFTLVNAYLYNLEMYARKQPESPFNASNKPADIVKRMVDPIKGTKSIYWQLVPDFELLTEK